MNSSALTDKRNAPIISGGDVQPAVGRPAGLIRCSPAIY